MKPGNFGGFTLYRIFYGERIVYLGRTMQPLQSRIRGHLFKKPMHRAINIEQVTKIEYATFHSEADMYLYEIYYINLWHPALNRDDKATDNLTVELPPAEWKLFETHLWEKWKTEITRQYTKREAEKKRRMEIFEKDAEMRRKRIAGEITEDEYWDFWEKEVRGL